jgi:hypothetical protein
LTSSLPPGSPEPVIEAVSLVVVGRQRLLPRPPVITRLFTGGGADGPVAFADFARADATTWPLRWRSEDEDNDLGYSERPRPLTFKYLKPGENIVVLVTEGPSVDGLVDDELPHDELFEVAARLDVLVGGSRVSVFSRQRLLLLEYSHTESDVLEEFDVQTMDELQRRTTLSDAGVPSLGAATAARDLWEAAQAVALLRRQPASRNDVIDTVKRLVDAGRLGEVESSRLGDLAQRLQR